MPNKDTDPPTITADSLHDLLKSGTKAAPSPAIIPPAPAPPAQLAPTQPPPLPIPVFGPPAKPITTEDILGHPLLPPAPVIPPQAAAEGIPEVGPRKQISDPLDRARRERSSSETKRKSELTVNRMLTDYPSTKMVNVRLQWRDPATRSYRKKGRIKNVSLNDIRDPESWCEGPGGVMYGGDWVMGYMPADQGKHFDDPKAWYEFDFDRDGPEPPREWTIDQPIQEHLYLEVDGMGQINLPDLTKLIESTVKQALTPATPVPPTGNFVPGQQPYIPGPPVPPYRDTKAEERERRLEEALAKSREQFDAVMQRLNEKEREAQEARFKAEREAADARHQAELHGVLAKLTAMEARLNQPPPAPPQPSNDFAAMSTLKEILVGNRTVEVEERRREAEERLRRLDEERQQRDREREEARDRREREREEERSRREEERSRREAADREAQRTLEQYRLMGESSLASARAVAEITTKQNDPAPTLTVMNAMAQQTVQQAQLLATLFKNFGQGGGSGTNWPELIAQFAPDAFRAVSDLGASIAQASENKAKIAAQAAAQAMRPPVPATQPQPSMAGMPPTAAPAPAPAAPAPVHPLSAYIARVNQAIGAHEDPEAVAGKLAAVVHTAQEFGTAGASKQITVAIRALQEDPLPFLKRAYPSSDPAYLEQIAKVLMEQFGPEEDGEEDEDEAEPEAEAATSPSAAQEPAAEPPQAPTPPQVVATPPRAPEPPVEPPAKPDVRIVVTGPDGVPRDATPSTPAASGPSEDGGNGTKKRRGRRAARQVPLPDVVGPASEGAIQSTDGPIQSTDGPIPSTTVD